MGREGAELLAAAVCPGPGQMDRLKRNIHQQAAQLNLSEVQEDSSTGRQKDKTKQEIQERP